MPWSEEDWAAFLSRELSRPVRVVYTRARRRVVHSASDADGVHLRLSACFADAPESIRADFARWMRVGRRARRACERLDAWIETAAKALPPARRARIRKAGAVHDLAPLEEILCTGELAAEFDERPRPQVTWGHRTGRKARHSLRLGSYDSEQHLVRVHPVLDQAAVPTWFVQYILFHELLHAVCPPRPDGRGHTLHHPPEYRRRERRYADWERAQRWQATNLDLLLVSARSGRPVPMRQPSLFE